MLSTKKKFSFFFKDFLFYGLLTGINKLSVVLTFPFLARYFSVESYGRLDFLINLVFLIIVIVIFGQDSSIGRYIQDQKKLENKKNINNNSLLIHFISLVFVILLLSFFKISFYFFMKKKFLQ